MVRLKRLKHNPRGNQAFVGSNSLRAPYKFSLRQYFFVLLGLLVLAGGILLFASTNPTATPYAKMIGINGTRADTNHDYLADAQSIGVQWERVVQWNDSSEGGLTMPQAETALNSHGIRAFLSVNNYGTSWVQDGSCSGANYTGTCTGKAAWVQAILHSATTYGKGGSYWAGKTDYGSPVIEVGNEVYGSWYTWPDQGWSYPDQYGKMLDQAAKAVATATGGKVKLIASTEAAWCDPHDLSNTHGGTCTWHNSFGADMLAAAPSLSTELAGVAVHPYGDIAAISVCRNSPCSTDVNFSHQVLYTVHSQLNLPVYVTEVGQKAGNCNTTTNVGTGCTTDGNQVGVYNQAKAMDYYFNELKTNSWEMGLFWYIQKDYHAFDPNADNGWALIDVNNVHQPAEAAYKQDALALEASVGGGGGSGDTTAPTVSISAPAAGATMSGSATVTATASDNVGVASVQLKLDGQPLGSALTTGPYSASWDTTKTANGTHTLSATATDVAGNVGTATAVTVTVNNVTAGGGYHVVGNVILDGSNKNFFPHGVDRPSLEWSCVGTGAAGGTGIAASDFSTMKTAWGANTVRIALNQDFWLGGALATHQGCTGAQYQQTVKNAVAAARAAGLVVILDLHWSDQGNLQGTSAQQCMPDANSNTFWQQVATVYKSDTGVWFELYNEPQMDTTSASWSIWKNGGSVCGFTATGMQTLLNTVRATGANNIAIAGGVSYASNLHGLVTTTQNYLLSGSNVAYAIHLYANSSNPNAYSTTDWDYRAGYLTTQVPVVATEFGNPQQTGSAACAPSAYDQAVLDYFRTHGMGYTAWAWYTDPSGNGGGGKGPCGFPVLISDAQGTCYVNDGACTTQADLLGFASGKLQMTVPGQPGGTPPTVQNFAWNATAKTLTWSAYPNAAGYTVATVHDPKGARKTTYVKVTGTSFSPPALDNETVNYGILPIDGNGNGLAGASWATEVTVVWPPLADTTPPSTPTGVTATAVSQTQINLTWQASTDNVGVAGYKIFRDGGSSPLVTVTTTTYGDGSLSANTSHSYTIKAFDAAGNLSSASAPASATTQPVPTTVTIRGKVTNASGAALAGVYVHSGSHGTTSGMATAYTDSSGSYILANITADHPHSYSYSISGYKSRFFRWSFPAGTVIENIILALRNG